MGRNTAATDWEYAGLMSASASVGLAGGGWLFTFRSKAADIWEDYVMLAAGLNTPGASVEVGLPDFASDDLSWTKISGKMFSCIDLDGATAYFTNEGVGAVLAGYSSLQLSVTNKWGAPLFSNQANDGYSAGIQFKPGVSFGGMGGILYSVGSVLHKVIVPLVNWSCWSVGAGSGLLMAGDALLAGRGISITQVFVEGYAWMLAECTDAGTWKISESEQEWYGSHRWEAAVNASAKVMKEMGSKSPTGTFGEAREAGAACIFQAMDYLYAFRGDEYYEALCKSHRELFGEDKNTRRNRYEEYLKAQVKEGKTASKIGIWLTV